MTQVESDDAVTGCDARLIVAGEWIACRVAEMSPEAAVLETQETLCVGDKVVACIAGLGALPAAVTAMAAGKCGIRFANVERRVQMGLPACFSRGR